MVMRRCCSLGDSETSRTIPRDQNESFRMTPPGEDSEFVVEVVTSLSNRNGTATPILNTGKIRVTSVGDGSTMLFDADGGDDSSATITLGNDSSGTAYSWDSWSDIFQQCCR